MNKLLPLLLLGFALLSGFVLRPAGYQVGDTATDFKLKNVDGKLVALADYPATKGFIVVFTCNTCPFAKAYEQRIIDLNRQFAPKGYPVVAINPNDPATSPGDSYAAMQQLARAHHYTFPYLQDETEQVARTYGATRTPHLYVLQRQGAALKVAYVGAIDDNSEDASLVKNHYLQDALNQLLTNQPIAQPTTQAIGCSIKWRKNG